MASMSQVSPGIAGRQRGVIGIDPSPAPKPLISVIVPFYDVEGCVDSCVGSLLRQDFDAYEIICVDDGSTDGTVPALDRLATAHPDLRVLHNTQNRGLSEARNLGVRMARADLVSFVDGDDVVSPHYLRLLHRAHGGKEGASSSRGHRVAAGTASMTSPGRTRSASARGPSRGRRPSGRTCGGR